MNVNQTSQRIKNRNRSTQQGKLRQRLNLKQILVTSITLFVASTIGLLIYFQIGLSKVAIASQIDDYRTVSSGNWDDAKIWESFDGSKWVESKKSPTSKDNNISISKGNIVVVNSKIKADQLTISENSKILIDKGYLEIENGIGSDFVSFGETEINGTIQINEEAVFESNKTILNQNGKLELYGYLNVHGVLLNKGGKLPIAANHISVLSNGVYVHNFDGGSIPLASWDKNSVCEITGIVNNIPKNLMQSYGNLKLNSEFQAEEIDLKGELGGIQTSLVIASTGKSVIYLDKESGNERSTINGSMIVQGGTTYISQNSSKKVLISKDYSQVGGIFSFNTKNSNFNSDLFIRSNVSITGGTLNLNSSSFSTIGNINIAGNLIVSEKGSITETSNNTGGQINFTGSTLQTINCQKNIINKINYCVVKGSQVKLDNDVLSGNGDFQLEDGAGLTIGSIDGISRSKMTGNIQVQGKREFSDKANYYYEGRQAQVTGDGLPYIVNSISINNSENVSLSNSISIINKLSLINGKLITGVNSLTIGINEILTGSIEKSDGYVIGNIKRWVNTSSKNEIEFPIGTETTENSAKVVFTTLPQQGGVISCHFGNGNLDKIGLPLTDGGEVCMNVSNTYWDLSAENGLKGGVFNLSLNANGFTGIQDFSKLHISRRNNLYSPWIGSGKHFEASGNNNTAIVNRKELKEFGVFGITSTTANSLPAQLTYFKATTTDQSVNLNWEVSDQINTRSYSVERSDNGSFFSSIAKIEVTQKTKEDKSYAYKDLQPLNGTAYYRLRQINTDGENYFSSIERVNLTIKDANSSSINIQKVDFNSGNSNATAEYFSKRNGDVSIEIHSESGKQFFKENKYALRGFNKFTFDKWNSLPSGNYVVSVSNPDGTVRKKITKME